MLKFIVLIIIIAIVLFMLYNICHSSTEQFRPILIDGVSGTLNVIPENAG